MGASSTLPPLSPISHLPYTLPSSYPASPFVCRSYKTPGVWVFFPFWNSSPSHPRSLLSCTYVDLFASPLLSDSCMEWGTHPPAYHLSTANSVCRWWKVKNALHTANTHTRRAAHFLHDQELSRSAIEIARKPAKILIEELSAIAHRLQSSESI